MQSHDQHPAQKNPGPLSPALAAYTSSPRPDPTRPGQARDRNNTPEGVLTAVGAASAAVTPKALVRRWAACSSAPATPPGDSDAAWEARREILPAAALAAKVRSAGSGRGIAMKYPQAPAVSGVYGGVINAVPGLAAPVAKAVAAAAAVVTVVVAAAASVSCWTGVESSDLFFCCGCCGC